MPDLTNGTTRDKYSELVKGYNKFEDQFGVNYSKATVPVEGSGDVDNIGLPLMWSESDAAFIEFAANADWVADTVTAVGDVVKPTTQNGYEYICTGISGDAKTHATTEPVWPTIPGVLITDDVVIWQCRAAYSGNGIDSPLSDGAHICVVIGPAEGAGFNYEDTTLSSTAVNMTVMFRGPAALAKDGFEWGSTAAADQGEFYKQLEKQGIALIESGTTVAPTFV